MPRPNADGDVFTAIADPTRRRLLELLEDGECPVGRLVDLMGSDQPTVSKHLGILRHVGLVAVRQDGRQRCYRAEAVALREVHDWSTRFRRHWQGQLGRIQRRAEALARTPTPPPST